jgi:hypothetical protein
VPDVELRFSEERVGAGLSEVDQSPQNDAGGGLRQRTEVRQVGLAFVRGQMLDDSAQVFEVEQR